MRKPRSLFWLIIIICALAIFIDLPKIPINFAVGSFKMNTVIGGYSVNFDLGSWRVRREFPLKLGLDLAGGVHMVLKADMSDIPQAARNQALQAVREVMERRVNLYGVSEPVVQTARVAEDYRIIVELPGVVDIAKASELVGQTAKLEFREVDLQATSSAGLVTEYYKKTNVGGADLSRALADFDQQTGQPQVSFELTGEGSKKFADLTRRIMDKPQQYRQLAIFLDDSLIEAPVVQSVIEGSGRITGNFTTDQTKRLAIQLTAGALPVSVSKLSESVLSATLGQEAVTRSVIAGSIGLVLVAGFMLFFYGYYGLLADLALVIYAVLTLAIFKIIPVTLTLAGITGFILSIGMAVDANILIFERMKEEKRWGKNQATAVELGFKRAWSSIRDSNISTLITCAILYWFGTGVIRGFALTLAIGVLVSMFTAVTVTKTFLRLTKKA
ncbi:protein translocase subunit SecD [Candidatus Daviesbacteria bacterium]|nr:protein translocase subunit SecD [Candidatus Daviesbacteria bacterium]